MLSNYFKAAENEIREWNDYLEETKRSVKKDSFLHICCVILLSITAFEKFPNSYYALAGIMFLMIIYGMYIHLIRTKLMTMKMAMISEEHGLFKKSEEEFQDIGFKLLNQLVIFETTKIIIFAVIVLLLFYRDLYI